MTIKRKLIIGIPLSIILIVGIYLSYKAYWIAQAVDRNTQILNYLFMQDQNQVTGFTKEVFNSIQLINKTAENLRTEETQSSEEQ